MDYPTLQNQLANLNQAAVTAAQTGPALAAAQVADAAARAALADSYQQFLTDLKAFAEVAPGLLAPPVGAAPLLPRPGGGAYLKLLSEATAALIKGAKTAGFKVGEGQIFAAAVRVVFDVIGGMPFAAAVAKEIATLLPDGVTLPDTPPPPPTVPASEVFEPLIDGVPPA